jgi:hypothetical protein
MDKFDDEVDDTDGAGTETLKAAVKKTTTEGVRMGDSL